MYRRSMMFLVFVLTISTLAFAADVPTFEQLNGELDKYKGHAKLEGATNAHLDMDGLAYYCVFDLALTVLNDPDHPKYAETKQAWDANQPRFVEQAGMVGLLLGKNLLPLLITASQPYARGFKDGAAAYAPNFNPDDFVHPLPVTKGEGAETRTFAWFHANGDADGDGVSNEEELLKLAPNWQPVKDENGVVKEGTGLGVTEEIRDKFIEEALGCKSWRLQPRPEPAAAETTAPTATE